MEFSLPFFVGRVFDEFEEGAAGILDEHDFVPARNEPVELLLEESVDIAAELAVRPFREVVVRQALNEGDERLLFEIFSADGRIEAVVAVDDRLDESVVLLPKFEDGVLRIGEVQRSV